MPVQQNTSPTIIQSTVCAVLLLLVAWLLTGCNSAPVGSATPVTNDQSFTPVVTEAPIVEVDEAPQANAADEINEEPHRQADQESIFSSQKSLDDIWSRMRQGFRLHQPLHPRITKEIEWYSSHPDYIVRIQERAAPLLHFILEETEKRGMPSEFALLPAVESAFLPFAYSPGRAAGLWQFIPSTGRHYGLEQNWWYDGRRDIITSTRAALDFLQALAKIFDGDWELALAAYNSGSGTVSRALKKNRKRGKGTDFWSLKLPKETQDYVPRLLAISKIIGNPAIYGITLDPIPNKPQIGTVDIGGQLDLALAAEMAGMPIKDIYRFNPGFNRWATAPDGPHHLTLPLDNIPPFLTALEKLDPSQRLRWKRYKINPGDSLSVIAKKHNTTLALLKQVNKIKGNRIRAGKHLLIPVSSQGRSHYALSATQRQQKIKNTTREGARITHQVQRGDNLWDIARTHKVSHRKLAKWNGMAPGDTLRLDQELVIWKQATNDYSGIELPNINNGPANRSNAISYRVRKGDSLARIAQRFNVRIADLRRWNKLPEKYLQPGQKLKLYVDITEQTL